MKTDRVHKVAKMSKEEILYRLLRKEHNYYKAILDFTDQENGLLIRERPLEEVNKIMKKKQILLSCIEEIDQALRPVKQLWQEKKDPESPFAKKVDEQLEALNSTINSILVLDEENQRLYKGALDKLRSPTAVG